MGWIYYIHIYIGGQVHQNLLSCYQNSFFIFFNLLLLFKVNQSLLSFFHFFYFFKLIKVLELRNYIHIEALLLFKREFNVILTRYFNPLKMQMTKILKYSNPLKMQMTKYIYFWLNVKKILIGRISPILILIIDNWYPWKKKNQKTQIFGDVIGKAWDGVNILDSHLYRRPSQSKSSIFVIKIPFFFFFNLLLLFKVNQSLLSFFHFFILFYFILFLSQSKSLKLRNYIDIEALLLFKREWYVIWTKYSNPLKTKMTKILLAFCRSIYLYIYLSIYIYIYI